MDDEFIALIQQLAGEANHHLGLAALRFAIDDERPTIELGDVPNGFAYSRLDADYLLMAVRQPTELALILVCRSITFLKPVNVKSRSHEKTPAPKTSWLAERPPPRKVALVDPRRDAIKLRALA